MAIEIIPRENKERMRHNFVFPALGIALALAHNINRTN